MKLPRLFAVTLIAVLPVLAQTVCATEENAARAQQLIEELHLSVLPEESGYLGIIGDSAQKVPMHGRLLKVQSQVYYMLTRERPINYLHWLEPDDTDYALMANALSPQWTADRVRIGEGAAWVKKYAGKAEWATPENLRALIGPNWKQ
jgi:hypothetical protein